MDPNQVPPQVGVNSGSTGASATGKSIFANPQNRFKDTNPNGDIIIPPSGGSGSNGSKKPLNKKLIVGIIAAVVVIAAVVAVVIATSGKKSGGSGGSGATVISDDDVAADVSAEVAEKFNKYANFIISGEASPERIPSEDEVDEPVIISKILDRDAGFMDEAKTYFDDFYNAFEGAEIEDDISLTDKVEYYKETFDFLYEYVKSDGSIEELQKMTDNPLAEAYAKAKAEFEAASAKKDTDSLQNNTAGKIIGSARSDVVFDCYKINKALYEGEEEETEEEMTDEGENNETE